MSAAHALGQAVDYRAALSDVGQQILAEAPAEEHARLCTPESADPKPWQWELSDVGLTLIVSAKETVPDRDKALVDGLLRDGVRRVMSPFQREVDASEQGSPEAELTLVFLIEKALGHTRKQKKRQPSKKNARRSSGGSRASQFQPNAKTEALKAACATVLSVHMSSTEAATVFESLCVQLDQYDPLEATEKFCRELFSADSFTRVSSRDQGKELAEAQALRLEAGALQPQPEPQPEPQLEPQELPQLNAAADSGRVLYSHHSNDAADSGGPDRENALSDADVSFAAAASAATAGTRESGALASSKQPQPAPQLIHAPLAPLTPRRKAEAAARRQGSAERHD